MAASYSSEEWANPPRALIQLINRTYRAVIGGTLEKN
jgi:hypothetical protein